MEEQRAPVLVVIQKEEVKRVDSYRKVYLVNIMISLLC